MSRASCSSRIRLVALVATLVAAGCTGTAGRNNPPGSTLPTTPAAGVTFPAAERPASPPSVDDGVGDSVPVAPPAPARATAEGFARAWARPHLASTTWLAGVAPFAAPNYVRLLATVDPANVPADEITGPLTAARATTDVAVFDAPADDGILRITCNLQRGRWVVTHTDWTRQRR